jgi:uncharacterized protein (DUF1330 family)
MSAFMLATIKVKDPEKFQVYLNKVQQLSINFGAKLLAKGKVVRNITGGKCDHGVTIVVQFPGTKNIDSLFNSEEYQALIPLREEGADIIMTSHQEM